LNFQIYSTQPSITKGYSMNKIGELLKAFYDGKLTKLQTEQELSLTLGNTWILTLINGEYVPVQYNEVDIDSIADEDDYHNWCIDLQIN